MFTPHGVLFVVGAVGVSLVLLRLLLTTFYRKVGPNKVLIVSGRSDQYTNPYTGEKVRKSFKIFHGGGHDEPLHDIIKTRGKFYYFNRGRYVSGTWRKGKVAEPFEFTLADGVPFKMAPGKTFVELPDTHAKVRIEA